jgi:alanyl-tRNA synthetase
VSESSIGSNLRRIEAVTGANTLALLQRDEHVLTDVARLVGASTDDLVGGVQRRLDEIKHLQDELKALRAQLATGRAGELAGGAEGGVVVQRVDGLSPGDLRELAIAVRQQSGVEIVVLAGISDSGGVSLVSAVTSASGKVAGELIKDAAKAVGGGGGGKGDVATAGGKNPDGIDEALRIAKAAATS